MLNGIVLQSMSTAFFGAETVSDGSGSSDHLSPNAVFPLLDAFFFDQAPCSRSARGLESRRGCAVFDFGFLDSIGLH